MEMTILIILGITLVLAAVSLLLTWHPSQSQVEAAAAATIEPAPWERENGVDLASPVAVEQPPAVAEPPAGARFRAASDALVNGPLVDEVVKGLEKIPPLPRALQQIVKELNDAGSTARSVGAIVATEQVLSATLLRVVNSASTGLQREIITVDHAVTYLGFSTVRALVMRLQLGALLPARAATGAYDAEKLWMHSLAVAQVAEHLSTRVGKVDPQLASTIGLLHDIGKLAINSQFPDDVIRLRQPGGPPDESFLARERRIFGADHAFIGAFLAARWGLPADLVDAIRLHHSPESALAALAPEVRRAILVAHVANQLVKYCHVYCEDMEIDIVPAAVLCALGLPEDLGDVIDSRVKQAIEQASRMGAAMAAT
jgi:putative nucleotidyltransferase with HDIG domain